ncbi:unnamed protein product [Dicrocoelium dendriticum]|nr:unnamed protein product [Dicrocoelium dendriticum]
MQNLSSVPSDSFLKTSFLESPQSKQHFTLTPHLSIICLQLEKPLAKFIEHRTTDSTSLWSANARTISLGWLRDGLKSRCITRDLKWGVPVPLDAYKDKVFYVWFDAPVGYMSITANYTKRWRCWWQPSGTDENDDDPNVELFQFMAKDNVPFHSIIFPACLLGANRGYTVVRQLLATEYMNYEGTKFSKSRGIGVFGNDAMKSGIDSNIWRFYLLYRRPETQDSSFMWDDFMLVNNSELLNNVGNFVHRALSFVSRFFHDEVPIGTNLEHSDSKFVAQVNQLIRSYANHFESGRLREALRQILSIARLGNCYVQANQPWVAVKSEETKPKASVVITVAANVACLIGLLLYPFMPTIARHIWCTQCNLPLDSLSLVPLSRQDYRMPQFLPPGHRIAKPTPLFRKIDTEEVSQLSQRFNGTQDCNCNEAA